MRAKALLESDLKDTVNLAEVQHAESLNLLYTSDLEKLADVWTTAERDRLKRLVLRYALSCPILIHILNLFDLLLKVCSLSHELRQQGL